MSDSRFSIIDSVLFTTTILFLQVIIPRMVTDYYGVMIFRIRGYDFFFITWGTTTIFVRRGADLPRALPLRYVGRVNCR